MSLKSISSEKYNSIKAKVAKILSVPNVDDWYLSDYIEEQGLVMTHPKNELIYIYPQLEGTVVDIFRNFIVSDAVGTNPIVITDALEPEENGDLQVRNELRELIHIERENYTIKPGYEGIYIRIFKHNGIIYLSSLRRFHIENSTWGKSPTYGQMWNRLEGSDGKIFFSAEKKFSPYTHTFLLSTQEVANVSRSFIGAGYISYLGFRQTWTPETVSLIEFNEIDTTLWTPTEYTENPDLASQTGIFLKAPDIDFPTANYRLRFGDYSPWDDTNIDPRLGTGETVVIYIKDKNGITKSLIHIQSTAYHWRTTIRENNPNLFQQWWKLVDLSLDANKESFEQKIPKFSEFSIESIIDQVKRGPLYIWEDSIPVETTRNKLYAIWAAMLMAVPLSSQNEVSEYYSSFEYSIIELAKYLFDSWKEKRKFVPEYGQKREIDIITNAISSANNFVSRSSKTVSNTKYEELVYKNILETLKRREKGTSIYRMISNKRKIEKFEESFERSSKNISEQEQMKDGPEVK
jgi:hypothetical protein